MQNSSRPFGPWSRTERSQGERAMRKRKRRSSICEKKRNCLKSFFSRSIYELGRPSVDDRSVARRQGTPGSANRLTLDTDSFSKEEASAPRTEDRRRYPLNESRRATKSMTVGSLSIRPRERRDPADQFRVQFDRDDPREPRDASKASTRFDAKMRRSGKAHDPRRSEGKGGDALPTR